MWLNKKKNFILSVIATTPQFPSYLSALLPQDQIFDSDSDVEGSPKKKKEKESENKDPSKDGNVIQKYFLTSLLLLISFC